MAKKMTIIIFQYTEKENQNFDKGKFNYNFVLKHINRCLYNEGKLSRGGLEKGRSSVSEPRAYKGVLCILTPQLTVEKYN